MGNIMYVVAAILFIGWLLGNFVFHFGAIIHVLLIIALVITIFRVIRGKQVF